MQITKKIFNEYIKVRFGKSSFKFFEENKETSLFYTICRSQGVETMISTIRRFAEVIDVPPRFVVRIIQLGGIKDEGFKGDNKGFNT